MANKEKKTDPQVEPQKPVIEPADEPITLGDSPPVQLEDLKTNQDSREN